MFLPFHDYSSPKKDTVHLYIVKNNSCVLPYHRIRLKSHCLVIFFMLLWYSRNACSESKTNTSKNLSHWKGLKHVKNNCFPSVSVRNNLPGEKHGKLLPSMPWKQSSGTLRAFSVADPVTRYIFICRYLPPHVADKGVLGRSAEQKKLMWEQNVLIHYNEAFYKWMSNHFCWTEKNIQDRKPH